MEPNLTCEIYKPQGRHKRPEQKRKERPPEHIDSRDKYKNDSVAGVERERKKRQDDRGSLQVQSCFAKNRVT